MKKTVLIAATLTIWALSPSAAQDLGPFCEADWDAERCAAYLHGTTPSQEPSDAFLHPDYHSDTEVAHAETPSPVLQSLPAKVQKDIEEVRAKCREALNGAAGIESAFVVKRIGAPGWSNDQAAPEWITSGDNGLIQFTVSGAQAVMVSDLELCGGLLLKSGNSNTVGSYALNIYVRAGDAWNNALSTMAGGSIFLSADSDGKFKALVLSVSGADEKNCKVKWWKEFCDMVVKWDGRKCTFKPL